MKIDSLCGRRKSALLVGVLVLWSLPVLAAESNCLLLTRTDSDQAQVLARQQLAQNKADGAARLCLATAAFINGDFHSAAQNFQLLANAEPRAELAAQLQSKAGWALMRANEPASAGKAFAVALKLMPHEARYWQDHATALMQTEQFWDARRELDYAITLAPRDAGLWALRAECWLKLGTPAQANHDARQALTLQPDHALALAIFRKTTREE